MDPDDSTWLELLKITQNSSWCLKMGTHELGFTHHLAIWLKTTKKVSRLLKNTIMTQNGSGRLNITWITQIF